MGGGSRWWWWWYFQIFFSKICFLKCTLDSNEEIHTGLINRTGAPEASVSPIHKNGRKCRTMDYSNGHSYRSQNSPTRVYFLPVTGWLNFFFLFSILKHIIIFYKQNKYVALFTKHSGFHITVQSSCWFAHFSWFITAGQSVQEGGGGAWNGIKNGSIDINLSDIGYR